MEYWNELQSWKRANRRHHELRMQLRRAKLWGVSPFSHFARILKHTAKPCSCWMCRNRRKDEGPTLQERRHPVELDD